MAWPIICLELHSLSQCVELSICFLIRKLTSFLGVGLHVETVSWRLSISGTNRALAGVWKKHFVGLHILVYWFENVAAKYNLDWDVDSVGALVCKCCFINNFTCIH